MSAESTAIRIRAAVCVTGPDGMLFVEHAKRHHRYWLLPGGGVEVGETMVEAARREALEETGYTTSVGRLLVVSEAIEPAGRHVVNVVFAATVTGGTLTAGCDGTLISAAWHSKGAVPELALHPAIGPELLAAWAEEFSGPVRYLGNIWRPVTTA